MLAIANGMQAVAAQTRLHKPGLMVLDLSCRPSEGALPFPFMLANARHRVFVLAITLTETESRRALHMLSWFNPWITLASFDPL